MPVDRSGRWALVSDPFYQSSLRSISIDEIVVAAGDSLSSNRIMVQSPDSLQARICEFCAEGIENLATCTFSVSNQSVTTNPIPNLSFSLLRRPFQGPFCVFVQLFIFCLRDRDHVGLLSYESFN